MIILIKFIFYISTLILVIISLYPGSLLGFLLYGDLGQQPNLIKNPFGTSLNHFIYYVYVSLLGFFLYLRSKNFQPHHTHHVLRIIRKHSPPQC